MRKNQSSEITLERPDQKEMCPIGYHIVRGHNRICKSGTLTWVDTLNAKSPQRNKSVYLKENIEYLYWSTKLEYYSALKEIKGFPPHHEIDAAIQFWINHWRSNGLPFPEDFERLIVKTIIAIEASFSPTAKSQKSTATGLMQITNTTLRDLAGQKRKGYRLIKDQFISVKYSDLKNPLINIAVGTRWLAAKVSQIPDGYKVTTYNLVKAYNQWNNEGDVYAKKVLALYEQSK